MGFIYSEAHTPEYGQLAALLVAMAREAGIHQRELQTVPNGFLVPDSISDQLLPPKSFAVADPRDEGKVPPPGWDEPLAPADVEFGDDGKVYLTPEAAAALEPIQPPVEGDGFEEALTEAMLAPVEVIYGTLNLDADMGDLDVLQNLVADEPAPVAKPESAAIRTWARENGLDVPVRGIVPKAIVEAYFEAHSGE